MTRQQLTKMEIDRVDLVDAGANGRRFALFKRDDSAASDEDRRSFIAKLTTAVGGAVATALGLPEEQPVAKAMTFGQMIAGREVTEALEDNWWVLSDALWSAIYATDDEGTDLSLDSKKALVGQSLDEFKAFLLERMDAGVEKSTRPSPGRLFEAFVAKVGRKISGAREARLREAADALTAVLAEVEPDDVSDETTKRATAQEEDMTPEELQAAIAKALEPMTAELADVKKQLAETKVEKSEDQDGDDEVTLAGVAEAVTKLAERIDGIEKAPGARQSAASSEAAPVKKSKFAGILD